MNSIKTNIAQAEKLILTANENGKQFEKIYPFSNENLASCLPNFNLENKDCLTVLGSGDQVLEMAYHNAKTITAFDINPLTEYYFYLKKAALMSNISYKEYLRFFCYEDFKEYPDKNNGAFNEKTFNKLVPYLKNDNYTFWSTLFNTFDYNPLEIRKSNGLFTADELSHQVLKQTISYLKEDAYYKLKEKASNIDINFLHCDIKTLENNLTEKYDFMYLSNIIQYTDKMYEKSILLPNEQNQRNGLENYKNTIENLGKHLKENDSMIANYLYEPNRDYILTYRGAIYEEELRTSIFRNYTYYYHPSINTMNFKARYGFNPDSDEDACLVYKKR